MVLRQATCEPVKHGIRNVTTATPALALQGPRPVGTRECARRVRALRRAHCPRALLTLPSRGAVGPAGHLDRGQRALGAPPSGVFRSPRTTAASCAGVGSRFALQFAPEQRLGSGVGEPSTLARCVVGFLVIPMARRDWTPSGDRREFAERRQVGHNKGAIRGNWFSEFRKLMMATRGKGDRAHREWTTWSLLGHATMAERGRNEHEHAAPVR